MDLEQYRKDIEFIKHYREASNAATGSKVDSNANVENKNITTWRLYHQGKKKKKKK